MQIFGEKNPNAEPFADTESEVFLRPALTRELCGIQNWQEFIPGPDQKISDLKEIITEIINQDHWVS